MNWINAILAQTNGNGTAPGGTPKPSSPMNLLTFALPLMLMFFLMFSIFGQKKKDQRERQRINDSLTKNQKVLTIGGIIGTVVSVKDNEVVLKVDESTNTRMTFLKSSIQRIVTDESHGTPAK